METIKLDHLNLNSADGTQLNMDALYRIAPSVFTEALDPKTGKVSRKVDFDALRQLLGDNAVEGDGESYRFTWVGKNAAKAEAARPTDKTLRPVVEDSVDWDNTKNIYIEGDNLEVLKLLQRSYLGKVKIIYIDPPYNTGNDFVYDDDFRRTAAEEDLEAGNVDELGLRYRKNTDTNGKFHSDWCSMIYPRLLVARSLLTEDGVIFISIDDNEVENLTKICREVFGESNYLTTITRATGTPTGGGFDGLVNELDYVIVFAKNISHATINGMEMSDKDSAIYDQEDENGRFLTRSLRRTGGEDRREDRPTMYYGIEAPDGTLIFPKGPTGYDSRWICSENKFKELERDNLIAWKKVSRNGVETWQVHQKFYLEGRTKAPGNLWNDIEGNKKATRDIRNLFDTQKVFDFPKPVGLLKKIISISCSKQSLILDFFGGSCTTAHAVMQLNAEDKGNRKFIMVQLPEETAEDSEAYKAGYKTIPEIGKERIRRAGKKIKEESPLTTQDLDTGFRVFRLDESNYEEVTKSPKDYDQNLLDLFANNIKADRTDLDLLFGAMLAWGVQLDMPMNKEVVDGCTIYTVNNGDLVACFSEGITDKVVTAMASKMPLRVLFRDSCFTQDAQKINIYEQFKQAMDWTDDEAFKNIKVI